MNRESGDFFATERDAPTDREAELDRLIASLPPAPGIKHIDEDCAEDDAKALADIAAGRCVPHEQVAEWLRMVGTPDYRPMPREWYE